MVWSWDGSCHDGGLMLDFVVFVAWALLFRVGRKVDNSFVEKLLILRHLDWTTVCLVLVMKISNKN